MSKFYLYLGIFLACTGIGTVAGILMIVFYFWDDIKKTINSSGFQNNPQPNTDPRFYDDETTERMR